MVKWEWGHQRVERKDKADLCLETKVSMLLDDEYLVDSSFFFFFLGKKKKTYFLFAISRNGV